MEASSIHIWIVAIGEPVPAREHARDRLHRAGAFAHFLAERGHEVIWWTSTFDHFHKKHIFSIHQEIQWRENLRIRLIHATGYRRNVSLQRLLDHWLVARIFRRLINQEPAKPDLILCALPTLELCHESVRYGERLNIPVIIDVRDLWPDIFISAAPKVAQGVLRLATFPLQWMARNSLAKASGIIGISEEYLQWARDKAALPVRSVDAVFPLGYEKPLANEKALAESHRKFRGLGVDESKCICWFVGSMGKTYDLAPVLQAARMLQSKGNNAIQFVFSGEGENRSLWAARARELKNVVFTGWVNATDLALLGSIASVGIAAYSCGAPQGIPNKILEYLSFGLPILSSLRGETEQLLKTTGCGMTYDNNNPQEIVDFIVRLKSDRAVREHMSERGRAVFENRFSASVIFPKMLDYIERISKRSSIDRGA